MRGLMFLPLATSLLVGCYEDGVFDDDDSTVDAGDDDSSPDDDDGTPDDDDATLPDGDGDGSLAGADCDDADSANFPGNPEVCDGQDNNCDEAIDEGLLVTRFQDFDNDGWGTGSVTSTGCPGAPGWASQAGDCNDTLSTIHPAAPEVCNALDDDCDGTADGSAVCPCPVEHWPDDQHPYMFCATQTSWFDAAADCGASDYRLVTFDSEAELLWTTATAISYASGQNWWIGFTDQASEGNWLWEDGSPGTYINWCGLEPNNSHGGECVAESAEHCAMLNWGEGGCWNDYPCPCSTIYRICEGVSELRPSARGR